MTQLFVRRRTSTRARWRGLRRARCARSTAAGATRCSTRWPSTSRARPSGPSPQGGLFIWATLPDYIDTTDLLARALRENVAFVPGRAAYLDGRGGSSMRLNFSGVAEDDIREGVRRIGKVVREQVGAVRHAHRRAPAPPGAPSRRPARRAGAGRRAASCPPRARRGAPRRRRRERGSRCSRAAARSSARSRCARARGSRTRSSASATRSSRSTSAPTWSSGCATSRPDVAFVALHGRDGEDGTVQELLEIARRPLHRLGRLGLHPLHRQGAGQARDARRRASRRPTSSPSTRPRSASSAPPTALPAIEERLGFPIVVKPAGAGLGARDQVRAHARPTCPAALVAAFSYDDKVLLERYVDGRDLAVSVLDGRSRGAADRRGGPATRRTSTTSRPATRSAAPSFVCPAELPDERGRARPGAGAATSTGCSAAAASRAST